MPLKLVLVLLPQNVPHLESGIFKFFSVSIQYFETVSEVSSFNKSGQINLLMIPSVFEKYCMARGKIVSALWLLASVAIP
jgi:hypothetical protein